jgi:hypothetical protein
MPQNSLTPEEAIKALVRVEDHITHIKPLMRFANPRVWSALQRIDNAFAAMLYALEILERESDGV